MNGKRWGIPVFGVAAIALGLVGLVSGDFADVWQPVPTELPGRTLLAYLVALLFVLAGGALVWNRNLQWTRAGAAMLGIFYFAFGMLWMPRVIAYPRIFGTWGGVFEQLSLVAAAIVVWAANGERKATEFARILYGVCAVAFGLNHFFAIPETARMVPSWIPPGQRFWAIATGIAHLLAGVAILSGVLAPLAARLLTAMIASFGLFVWLPMLLARPSVHMVWSGNAINLAMLSAAWVIADHCSRRAASVRETDREWKSTP